ncbi:hypothetical protein WA158_006952 [Blastocystis sp. Blastoise]
MFYNFNYLYIGLENVINVLKEHCFNKEGVHKNSYDLFRFTKVLNPYATAQLSSYCFKKNKIFKRVSNDDIEAFITQCKLYTTSNPSNSICQLITKKDYLLFYRSIKEQIPSVYNIAITYLHYSSSSSYVERSFSVYKQYLNNKRLSISDTTEFNEMIIALNSNSKTKSDILKRNTMGL